MASFTQKEIYRLFFFALCVLISRLPFLNEGYGVEEDSWGIAVAAYNSYRTGILEASRLPGHPVNEIVYSLLWGCGPQLYNFLSALCSIICFMLFYNIAKQLRVKHYLWASWAFIFTPVVYINSTCTLDYIWALMFCLASFYHIIKKYYWLAGILLGLSVGCRITNLGLILPFALWIFYSNESNYQLKQIIKIAATTLVVSFICYIPIIQVYGINFFSYSDQFPYPNIYKLVYKSTIGVVGLLGAAALFFCMLYLFFKKQKTPAFKPLNYLFCSLLILNIIVYMSLPQKSAYLITIVPFLILWMAYKLPSVYFVACCICLVLSSFVLSINLTDEYRGANYSKFAVKKTIAGQEIFLDFFNGPIISDFSKRKLKISYTQAVIKKAAEFNYPVVIIAGWWYNQIVIQNLDKKQSNAVKYIFYADKKIMDLYLSKGYQIYYLREQEIYNDLMFKITDTKKKSVEFPLEF